MTIDANDLEKIAKERPDECFLKGSGVLKLIGAIRQLESEARRATVSDAQPVGRFADNAAPEGQELSIDVSTGEDDARHRVYARLTGEVVPTGDGAVWLAEKTGQNFNDPDVRPSVLSVDAKDAARYRRLQILGAAPYGHPYCLGNGTVLRFQSLDQFVDADLGLHPSRGEFAQPVRPSVPVSDAQIKPRDGWAVHVEVDAVRILSIESECLSGVHDIDRHADTVRNCAQHLLSFIGNGEPAEFFPPDDALLASQPAAPSADPLQFLADEAQELDMGYGTDAERLDFLISEECQIWEINHRYSVRAVTEAHPITGEHSTAREAIDAAIAAQSKDKP